MCSGNRKLSVCVAGVVSITLLVLSVSTDVLAGGASRGATAAAGPQGIAHSEETLELRSSEIGQTNVLASEAKEIIGQALGETAESLEKFGFAVDAVVSAATVSSLVSGDPWRRFNEAYPKAVRAVQNASLSGEKKKELLNMLEIGKKINTKSAAATDRKQAKKYADEAMSILNEVTKIVESKG